MSLLERDTSEIGSSSHRFRALTGSYVAFSETGVDPHGTGAAAIVTERIDGAKRRSASAGGISQGMSTSIAKILLTARGAAVYFAKTRSPYTTVQNRDTIGAVLLSGSGRTLDASEPGGLADLALREAVASWRNHGLPRSTRLY